MARRWQPLARMIEASGYTAIDGIRNFQNRRIPLALGSFKPLEGSLHHSWDSVPDTWRPHELLLQDRLKWHVNAKGRCNGAGLLCIPIVLRSWFTPPEVCRAGIVKHTVKLSNSVHCGELSRLLCHYVVNTQLSLLIGNTSEIAKLQRHIKGIGALKFPVQTGCIPMTRLCLPGTLYARPNSGHPQNM